MSFGLGVLSAVIAPLLMVIGFILWDNHWTGSVFSLNMLKCLLASCGFLVLSMLTRPLSWSIFTMETVGFLMLSSTIGLLIGDLAWLEGMRVLGARKIIVLDSLKPFLAAIVGKIFLGETLQSTAYIGLLFTVLGVLIVGFEKEQQQQQQQQVERRDNDKMEEQVPVLPNETDPLSSSTIQMNESSIYYNDNNNHSSNDDDCLISSSNELSYADERRQKITTTSNSNNQSYYELYYGLIMGILNVIFHTFGALITKVYGVNMNTWEINLVRFGFAGLVMLFISIVMTFLYGSTNNEKQHSTTSSSTVWYVLPSNMRLSWWIRIACGIGMCSFLCPALTNYAMFQIALALLLTLESIGPIYSLPIAYILEKGAPLPTIRAIFGTFLAVFGIFILASHGKTNNH